MKLLFVSSLYPTAIKNEFALNGKRGASLQNQVNGFQWAMMEALVLNKLDFKVVSFPAL